MPALKAVWGLSDGLFPLRRTRVEAISLVSVSDRMGLSRHRTRKRNTPPLRRIVTPRPPSGPPPPAPLCPQVPSPSRALGRVFRADVPQSRITPDLDIHRIRRRSVYGRALGADIVLPFSRFAVPDYPSDVD